jgi:hypothetical protein
VDGAGVSADLSTGLPDADQQCAADESTGTNLEFGICEEFVGKGRCAARELLVIERLEGDDAAEGALRLVAGTLIRVASIGYRTVESAGMACGS